METVQKTTFSSAFNEIEGVVAKVGQVVDPVWKQISLLYFLPIHHFVTLSIAVYNLGHFVSKVDAAFQ